MTFAAVKPAELCRALLNVTVPELVGVCSESRLHVLSTLLGYFQSLNRYFDSKYLGFVVPLVGVAVTLFSLASVRYYTRTVRLPLPLQLWVLTLTGLIHREKALAILLTLTGLSRGKLPLIALGLGLSICGELVRECPPCKVWKAVQPEDGALMPSAAIGSTFLGWLFGLLGSIGGCFFCWARHWWTRTWWTKNWLNLFFGNQYEVV